MCSPPNGSNPVNSSLANDGALSLGATARRLNDLYCIAVVLGTGVSGVVGANRRSTPRIGLNKGRTTPQGRAFPRTLPCAGDTGSRRVDVA